jgi:hypothetical protein
MKRIAFIALATTIVLSCSGVAAADEPLRLVDTPTAGLPAYQGYVLESHLDGSVYIGRALTGISRYAAVGVSWGGGGLIGSGGASWQPHLGMQARVRLVEESMTSPAVLLGFDSQGEGKYLRGGKLDRFQTKSRGVYLAVSRNYRFYGNLGVHCGANWSLETDDGDSDPSFWAGFDKDIGPAFDLCCEYDFATNENTTGLMKAGSGRFNTAVKWRFGSAFSLEFDVRNIHRTGQRDTSGAFEKNPFPSREIRFSYSGAF